MKIIMSLVVFTLLSSSAFARRTYCPDETMQRIGFTVYPTQDFSKYEKKVMRWLERSSKDFEMEMSSKIWSHVSKSWIEVFSYDNIKSPSMEMLGDVFIIRDLDTQEIVEVRWYENSTKKLVYNQDYQRCSTDLIPIVENALF